MNVLDWKKIIFSKSSRNRLKNNSIMVLKIMLHLLGKINSKKAELMQINKQITTMLIIVLKVKLPNNNNQTKHSQRSKIMTRELNKLRTIIMLHLPTTRTMVNSKRSVKTSNLINLLLKTKKRQNKKMVKITIIIIKLPIMVVLLMEMMVMTASQVTFLQNTRTTWVTRSTLRISPLK